MRNLLCITLLTVAVMGCYRSKGYTIDCEHPDGRSYYITEAVGLTKEEYNRVKKDYESKGYICE